MKEAESGAAATAETASIGTKMPNCIFPIAKFTKITKSNVSMYSAMSIQIDASGAENLSDTQIVEMREALGLKVEMASEN